MGSVISVLIVVIFIVSSIYKAVKKQEKNEWDKTTLPGQGGGKEIVFPNETESQPTFPVKKVEKKVRPAIIPTATSVFVSPSPISGDATDPDEISFLDTSDSDEIKKAIIYSEIFKRKDY